MQRLEVSGAVRPIYGSLGVKRLMKKSVHLVGIYVYVSHCNMFVANGDPALSSSGSVFVRHPVTFR